MPTVQDRRYIDIDDIAVLQNLVARDAVADNVIDRGAAAFGVAAIAERGGNSAGLERHALDDRVNLSGRDPRNYLRHKCVKYLCGKTARAAHPFEAFWPVELDHMAARLGPVFGADLDIFGHDPKIG